MRQQTRDTYSGGGPTLKDVAEIHPEITPPEKEGEYWTVCYEHPKGPQYSRILAFTRDEAEARDAYTNELRKFQRVYTQKFSDAQLQVLTFHGLPPTEEQLRTGKGLSAAQMEVLFAKGLPPDWGVDYP